MEYKSLAMISLRGATLASKFLLVMYLAKYASYQILADYTLIAITISFLLYFLGFDFYTFSSREIIKKGFTQSGRLLINQFYVYGIMYLAVIPVIVGINHYNILKVGFYFYFVLITEHLAQELMRIIVINNKPIKANFQFFLRSSFWIYIYIAYSYFYNVHRLDILLLFWFISNIFAIIYSTTEFRLVNTNEGSIFNVDIKWIKNGILIAIPLLITTLMLRGLYISDRYLLKFLSSTEELAVYSFYSNMSNALIAFIDAAVVMRFYPKVISTYNSKNKKEYETTIHLFKNNIKKTGISVLLLLSVIMPGVCIFLNKQEFIQFIVVFYLLLIAAYIYSYALVPHYELYARKSDSILLICTGITFIVGVILQYFLGLLFGGIGMAVAVLLVSMMLLITKLVMLRKVKIKEVHFTH